MPSLITCRLSWRTVGPESLWALSSVCEWNDVFKTELRARPSSPKRSCSHRAGSTHVLLCFCLPGHRLILLVLNFRTAGMQSNPQVSYPLHKWPFTLKGLILSWEERCLPNTYQTTFIFGVVTSLHLDYDTGKRTITCQPQIHISKWNSTFDCLWEEQSRF